MRFETSQDAWNGLSNEATHEAAARILLAHADVFDFQSSWAFARPMMRCIVAMRRDYIDDRRNVAGPETYEALTHLESYFICNVFSPDPNPWSIKWNPDIDAPAAHKARKQLHGDE